MNPIFESWLENVYKPSLAAFYLKYPGTSDGMLKSVLYEAWCRGYQDGASATKKELEDDNST